jgi:hypothetical protein
LIFKETGMVSYRLEFKIRLVIANEEDLKRSAYCG